MGRLVVEYFGRLRKVLGQFVLGNLGQPESGKYAHCIMGRLEQSTNGQMGQPTNTKRGSSDGQMGHSANGKSRQLPVITTTTNSRLARRNV